ncbi:MAG: 50S ribosomal protein L17 [Candidatus Staskawiczbacteria bacterium]|nr:50S ribosomal protein L17 [Candidatus Staskawiczbacteria bacterium]
MRKQKKGRVLSRDKSQREALLKSLASSFFLHEKIRTTQAKAKELKIFAERSITRAKQDTVFNRRLLAKTLAPKIVKKLVSEIAPRYKERPGGYTRITKLGQRKSDSAKIVIVELV